LALWNGKKNYNEFAGFMKVLLDDMKAIQQSGVKIEGVWAPVSLFLTGDWKFLAMVMGLGSPNLLNGFCLWCLAHKKDLATPDFFKMRNMEEVLKFYPLDGECKDKCKAPVGQERANLFSFIPFQRVLIDPLHAFLRIGGKLIELAFEKIYIFLINFHLSLNCSPS